MSIKQAFFIFFILLLSSACASTSVDLVKEKHIIIKTDDSPKGTIRNIKVEKYGDAVLISGLVTKNTRMRILKGHVHIDIFDKANVIQKSIEGSYRFRRSLSKSAKSARFTAALTNEPSPDTRLVITHHDAKTRQEPGRSTPDEAPVLENGGGLLIIE